METYVFLTFIGGMLVGMGLMMFVVVLTMVWWSKRRDA